MDAICDALVAKKMQKDNFLYYIWNDLLSATIDKLSKIWWAAPSGTSRSVCIIGRGFVSMAKHLALKLNVKLVLYPQTIKSSIETEDCIICVLNEASFDELRQVKMLATTLKCANKKCVVLYHTRDYEHTNSYSYDNVFEISVPILNRNELEDILARMGIALCKVDIDSISFPIVFSDLFKNHWISDVTSTSMNDDVTSMNVTSAIESTKEKEEPMTTSETDDFHVIVGRKNKKNKMNKKNKKNKKNK